MGSKPGFGLRGWDRCWDGNGWVECECECDYRLRAEALKLAAASGGLRIDGQPRAGHDGPLTPPTAKSDSPTVATALHRHTHCSRRSRRAAGHMSIPISARLSYSSSTYLQEQRGKEGSESRDGLTSSWPLSVALCSLLSCCQHFSGRNLRKLFSILTLILSVRNNLGPIIHL